VLRALYGAMLHRIGQKAVGMTLKVQTKMDVAEDPEIAIFSTHFRQLRDSLYGQRIAVNNFVHDSPDMLKAFGEMSAAFESAAEHEALLDERLADTYRRMAQVEASLGSGVEQVLLSAEETMAAPLNKLVDDDVARVKAVRDHYRINVKKLGKALHDEEMAQRPNATHDTAEKAQESLQHRQEKYSLYAQQYVREIRQLETLKSSLMYQMLYDRHEALRKFLKEASELVEEQTPMFEQLLADGKMKQEMACDTISSPTDFKQISHVGVDAEGQMQMDGVPPDWLEMFEDMNKNLTALGQAALSQEEGKQLVAAMAGALSDTSYAVDDAALSAMGVESAFPQAVALFDYEPQDANDLALTAGCVVEVYDQSEPDWWSGHRLDDPAETAGYFPSKYVEETAAAPPADAALPPVAEGGGPPTAPAPYSPSEATSLSGLPPPPPPPPSAYDKSAAPVRTSVAAAPNELLAAISGFKKNGLRAGAKSFDGEERKTLGGGDKAGMAGALMMGIMNRRNAFEDSDDEADDGGFGDDS